MRKRIPIPQHVWAHPKRRLVSKDREHYLYNTTVEDMVDMLKTRREIEEIESVGYLQKKYAEKLAAKKMKINEILGDVFVVIPQYPDNAVSDIILLINGLKDEPNDVIATEICKKLNL